MLIGLEIVKLACTRTVFTSRCTESIPRESTLLLVYRRGFVRMAVRMVLVLAVVMTISHGEFGEFLKQTQLEKGRRWGGKVPECATGFAIVAWPIARVLMR